MTVLQDLLDEITALREQEERFQQHHRSFCEELDKKEKEVDRLRVENEDLRRELEDAVREYVRLRTSTPEGMAESALFEQFIARARESGKDVFPGIESDQSRADRWRYLGYAVRWSDERRGYEVRRCNYAGIPAVETGLLLEKPLIVLPTVQEVDAWVAEHARRLPVAGCPRLGKVAVETYALPEREGAQAEVDHWRRALDLGVRWNEKDHCYDLPGGGWVLSSRDVDLWVAEREREVKP